MPGDQLPDLSPREENILNCSMSGLTDKEIAHSLKLSLHTVRTYWNRIRGKLQMDTRAEVIAWAAERRGEESSQSDMASHLAKADAKRMMLEEIVGKVPIIIWASDIDGQVYYVNDYFLEYTGLKLGDALPYPWPKVIEPIYFERWKQDGLAALRLPKPHEFYYPVRNRSGEYRWHLERDIPILDDDKNVIGRIGVGTDVHDLLVQCNNSLPPQKRLLLATEIADVGIAYSNPSANIKYSNLAYERLYGGIADKSALVDIVNPEDRDHLMANWEAAKKEGISLHSSHQFQHPDGSTTVARLTIQPLEGDAWVVTAEKQPWVASEKDLKQQLVKLANLLNDILKEGES